MDAEAACTEAPSISKRTLTFLDLPIETQQDIVSHCSQSDLICVALVSKHFHELASSQLYRSFHIIFPDEDDLGFDSPIDGLAGGLDTFTTSEYNYAKHLKDLSMDTLSAGAKAEHAYKSYLYSASCGKFLNTLLYLTLKKANSLEVFRWNVRVELSRPVYRELHKIASLTKLHVRMQAGESYYSPPPPLPVSIDAPEGPVPISNHWTEVPSLSPGPLTLLSLPVTGNPSLDLQLIASSYPTPGPPPIFLPPPSRTQSSKSKACRRSSASTEPPTLSGFKNLKSLSVLDIDTLDVISELKTCVRNSSLTLTELSLSFSESLAIQARKPPPDSDPDDSDVDDEFPQATPPSQSNGFDASGPATTFRAQEERKLQEAVLGRIFDVEAFPMKKALTKHTPPISAPIKDENRQKEEATALDPREEFVSSIKCVSNKLMFMLNGSRDFSASQQDILDVMEKAARKYVESGGWPESSDANTGVPGEASAQSKNGESTKSPEKAAEAGPLKSAAVAEEAEMTAVAGDGSVADSGASSGTALRGISPDDIDIEHLDSAEDGTEERSQASEKEVDTNNVTSKSSLNANASVSELASFLEPVPTSSADSQIAGLGKALARFAAQRSSFENLVDELTVFERQADTLVGQIRAMRSQTHGVEIPGMQAAEHALSTLSQRIADTQAKIKLTETGIGDAEKLLPLESQADPSESNKRRYMSDYIRDTRGFSLEKLSIYLIPVKASVLSRAIDLRSLKQLTLLNVGNQAPLWTLLSKENKVHPLALRSVFTDNVCNAFLNCMSQLDELYELFMLERSTKYKPESFAPRSTTTIDQIRRLILKKHIHTLKRLMIKDESNSPGWDANQKAMILICTRGVQLEELAVSMNIHAVHAFMQYFSGLVSLRAINILHFRNNDTCIWVMREILRFIVDNLSHHPELKLEWIAMEDDRVDRVIRPSEDPDSSDDEPKKNKGKGKAPVVTGTGDTLPVLPIDGWDSESDSDDEDGAFDSGKRLRLKTVGPLQFYDVWGVKIFEKEIRSGRL